MAVNLGDIGTGVSDIFSGLGDIEKMKGDELEAQNYSNAAIFAGQEATYSQMSTAIQAAQEQRQVNLSLGRTQSEVAGAGFSMSGSALDIMRSSASQGALAKAVTQEQGNITTAGYKEQQAAYENMAQSAEAAAKGENLASIASFAAGGLKILAGL